MHARQLGAVTTLPFETGQILQRVTAPVVPDARDETDASDEPVPLVLPHPSDEQA